MSASNQIRTTDLPPGDARKGWWNYEDLSAVFGLGVQSVKRRMTSWEAEGFPRPLPFCRREKRWHPPAVQGWKQRYAIRMRADDPKLRVIQGGQPQ